jgi:hypothetical protein
LNPKATLWLLLLIAAWQCAAAEGLRSQLVDPDDGRFDASAFLANNAYGFLPIPIIITDPAVNGGLGAAGLFFHESEAQKAQRLQALREAEDGTRFLLTPNISVAAAAVTGNDSWFLGGGHIGFFRQGRMRYMVGAGYGDVNLDFFGFGDIGLTRPVELNTSAAGLMQSLKFRAGNSNVFIGPSQRLISARIEPRSLGDLDGDLLPPPLQDIWQDIVRRLLTQDVVTSAMGITVEFDSRDNFFSPKSGYKYEIEHLWYRDFFGSDVEFELMSFSGLHYWQLTDRFRVAMRLAADYAATDTLLPPFATPGIELRGLPALRYQGNAVAVAETELTWQIDKRWSVLGFAGGGRAANELDDLSDSPSRVTKGAGFRYLVAKRYGFEMGLDFAIGPEENVVYIQGGTAWR